MRISIFFILSFLILSFASANAQGITDELSKVKEVISDQSPSLEEYAEKLSLHKIELSERAIVLKYHEGNKEVDQATNDAIDRIQEYNKQVHAKVAEYESVWYDLMPKIIAIYTRYGELKEATGGGATELDDFVAKHRDYMELMDVVQSDLDFIDADCGVLRQ